MLIHQFYIIEYMSPAEMFPFCDICHLSFSQYWNMVKVYIFREVTPYTTEW